MGLREGTPQTLVRRQGGQLGETIRSEMSSCAMLAEGGARSVSQRMKSGTVTAAREITPRRIVTGQGRPSTTGCFRHRRHRFGKVDALGFGPSSAREVMLDARRSSSVVAGSVLQALTLAAVRTRSACRILRFGLIHQPAVQRCCGKPAGGRKTLVRRTLGRPLRSEPNVVQHIAVLHDQRGAVERH